MITMRLIKVALAALMLMTATVRPQQSTPTPNPAQIIFKDNAKNIANRLSRTTNRISTLGKEAASLRAERAIAEGDLFSKMTGIKSTRNLDIFSKILLYFRGNEAKVDPAIATKTKPLLKLDDNGNVIVPTPAGHSIETNVANVNSYQIRSDAREAFIPTLTHQQAELKGLEDFINNNKPTLTNIFENQQGIPKTNQEIRVLEGYNNLINDLSVEQKNVIVPALRNALQEKCLGNNQCVAELNDTCKEYAGSENVCLSNAATTSTKTTTATTNPTATTVTSTTTATTNPTTNTSTTRITTTIPPTTSAKTPFLEKPLGQFGVWLGKSLSHLTNYMAHPIDHWKSWTSPNNFSPTNATVIRACCGLFAAGTSVASIAMIIKTLENHRIGIVRKTVRILGWAALLAASGMTASGTFGSIYI